MSFSDIMPLAAGLLQFGVACYTLRLLRLFGAPRAGWQLFTALAGLAVLCYLLFPFSPIRASPTSTVDLIYAAISMLLLAGLVHIDSKFRKRLVAEGSERRAQTEFEAQAEQEFQKLARYNEELRLAAKRQSTESARTTQDLQQAIERLQLQVNEHERQKKELQENHSRSLQASHQAGKTELAQEVVNGLSEVKALARRQLDATRIHFARVARQMRPTAAGIGSAPERQPRGRRTPNTFANLTASVTAERSQLLEKIDSLRQRLIQATGIVAANAESVVIDAALPAATPSESYCGPTETTTAGNGSNGFAPDAARADDESTAVAQPLAPASDLARQSHAQSQ